MTGFKAIETQEELDRIIQDRLNRQKETFEKQYSDYEQLKSRNSELETQVGNMTSAIEESKTSAANFETQISELNTKISGFETANMRTRIALQNGLPYDLADRLVGTDEESFKADAERLVGLMGNNAPVPPLKNPEPALGDGKDGAYKSLIQNLNLEGE